MGSLVVPTPLTRSHPRHSGSMFIILLTSEIGRNLTTVLHPRSLTSPRDQSQHGCYPSPLHSYESNTHDRTHHPIIHYHDGNAAKTTVPE